MTRILAYTSPARGHLYPIVGTLLELQQRGHEVHVRTLASEVAILRRHGLHAAAVAPRIEATTLDTWKAASPEEGLALALATFGERSVHEVPDLQAAIAQVKPDALLVDITTVGAAAVAESEGIPWAQSIPLFQHFSFGPDAPTRVTMVPFGIAPEGIAVLDAPRRRLNLQPLAGRDDVWRARLQLYYTAPPFEDPGFAFPPSFRLVGPGLWEPPSPEPDWLTGLDRPLVLISVSSEYQHDDALVDVAFEALRSDDVDVVATTAAHPADRFQPPPNARVAAWLPHGPLLRRAAVTVCHGGMGITQKSVAAGVPVCVVPFGRDQFEVASRVTASGAGTQVMPHELDATRLRAAVHRAMTMRPAAQQVAAAMAMAGGAGAAADAFEAHVDASRRNSPMPV